MNLAENLENTGLKNVHLNHHSRKNNLFLFFFLCLGWLFIDSLLFPSRLMTERIYFVLIHISFDCVYSHVMSE